MRGSHQQGQHAIHLVSAYGAGLGLVLGQVRTADKSNEITAIPKLIDALLPKGAIVTIDAMGCQRAIACKIVDAGAHYVLCRQGQPQVPLARVRLTHEAIDRLSPEKRSELVSEHHEIGKDHGRIATRHCVAFEWAALGEASPWPYARSAAIVEATR